MKKCFLMFLVVIYFGCKNNKDVNPKTSHLDKSNIETNDKTSSSHSSFDRNCVLTNIQHFEKILSVDEITSITGESAENITTKYEESVFNQKLFTYSWIGEQSRQAKVYKNYYPMDKQVIINAMDEVQEVSTFKIGYYPKPRRIILSEDEVKQAIAGKSTNKNLVRTVKNFRERGMTDQEILDLIAVKKDAEEYTEQTSIIEGYGDAATWDNNTHEFRIIADQLNFVITVDLNPDGDKDLKIAKEIANLIFKKCKN